MVRGTLCGKQKYVAREVRVHWVVMYEHSECQAIEVVGQDWSSEVVALFLDDWELGRVALSCHMAMDLLCQENEGLLY